MDDDSTLLCRDREMRRSMLNWNFDIEPADALAMQIRTREIAAVRVSNVAGSHCQGSRDASQAADDAGDFVGIMCELEGSEVCSSQAGEWQASPGDVIIWDNHQDLSFRVDDWSRKLILLVPAVRFQTVLRQPMGDPAWTLPGSTALGALISSFMIALASNLDRLNDDAAESAIDMALDLVGSAINTSYASSDQPKRTSTYRRILGYINRNLEDTDLSPLRIAEAHGISMRYLHLIFAENDGTVSGYIRERRLLRCREELERYKSRSLTEIAHSWGFCDGAHFSRTFKKRFGLPPKLWRTEHSSQATVSS